MQSQQNEEYIGRSHTYISLCLRLICLYSVFFFFGWLHDEHKFHGCPRQIGLKCWHADINQTHVCAWTKKRSFWKIFYALFVIIISRVCRFLLVCMVLFALSKPWPWINSCLFCIQMIVNQQKCCAFFRIWIIFEKYYR